VKFKAGDRVFTTQHGYREFGVITDSWFDGIENRYYIKLGKFQQTWSIAEKWIKQRG
jgi:hypothetical protein